MMIICLFYRFDKESVGAISHMRFREMMSPASPQQGDCSFKRLNDTYTLEHKVNSPIQVCITNYFSFGFYIHL